MRLGLTQRGRLRRQIRFLRKQRELQMRDLGGLIFDMYRFGSKRQDLVREKLRLMFEADRELREFEAMLGGGRRGLEVREPGVGGSCPRCLTLYSTDAHYCWRCGLALTEHAEAESGGVRRPRGARADRRRSRCSSRAAGHGRDGRARVRGARGHARDGLRAEPERRRGRSGPSGRRVHDRDRGRAAFVSVGRRLAIVSTTTTEPASRLRCPHCGASLAADQDWCLECGAAATTRILRPPSWKLAAAIVLGVVAAVVVAMVIVVERAFGRRQPRRSHPRQSHDGHHTGHAGSSTGFELLEHVHDGDDRRDRLHAGDRRSHRDLAAGQGWLDRRPRHHVEPRRGRSTRPRSDREGSQGWRPRHLAVQHRLRRRVVRRLHGPVPLGGSGRVGGDPARQPRPRLGLRGRGQPALTRARPGQCRAARAAASAASGCTGTSPAGGARWAPRTSSVAAVERASAPSS